MVPHDLITALPFWDAKEKQFFRRQYCQGKDESGAIQCRYDRMLPWMIKNQSGAPTYVYLVTRSGSLAIDITALLTILNGTQNGTDYCYHEGSVDINQATSVNEYGWNGSAWVLRSTKTWANWVDDEAYYYLEINFGGTLYYSELMRISDFPEFPDNPADCKGARVRIECASDCMVGDVPPLGTQKFFVEGETVRPQYELSREVGKDGEDEEKQLWAKGKKRYTVAFYAYETLADFVSTIPLYSTINVTDQNGFQSAVKDVDFRISWPESQEGCLALVELSYSIEHIPQTFCC